MTLTVMAVILRYFAEFGSFQAHYVKVVYTTPTEHDGRAVLFAVADLLVTLFCGRTTFTDLFMECGLIADRNNEAPNTGHGAGYQWASPRQHRLYGVGQTRRRGASPPGKLMLGVLRGRLSLCRQSGESRRGDDRLMERSPEQPSSVFLPATPHAGLKEHSL